MSNTLEPTPLATLPKIVLSSPISTRFSSMSLICNLTVIESDLGTEFVQIHEGPTDTSNWLIPGRILMSAYPSDQQSAKALLKARQLLTGGIRTFVCLQQKSELTRFHNYQVDIENEFKNMVLEQHLDFINFEIPDNYFADDIDVDNFTNDLVERYKRGENILIHCWGGHGRTGTICSILLGKLYPFTAEECLKRVQAVHDCRINPRGSRAPQTQGQIDQVIRLLEQNHDEPEEYIDTKDLYTYQHGHLKINMLKLQAQDIEKLQTIDHDSFILLSMNYI
jgi:hypothetical protein